MRPGSAISADGPLNLYNSVLRASRREARGHGVLVLLNDRIHAARFVAKTNCTQADAFDSPEQGSLGLVHDNRVHLYHTPSRMPHLATELHLARLKALPQVDIIYDHQSACQPQYQATLHSGPP